MSPGRVITFYSYKGGVGRTQALASIGTLLSRWGYKVLCVDWDLEAPGLDRYFRQWLGDAQSPGVVELIHAHVEQKAPQWKKYLVELNIEGAGQTLHLMPAGIQDKIYKQRIQGLNWGVLYAEHGLGEFLERMRDEWRREYDFVLVDSRTGITDIGGICTIQLPDQLVLLFTANHQSLDGIVDIWRSALAGRDAFAFDRGHLLALPVATRFEHRVEYQRAQEWLKKFATVLQPIYSEWASREVETQELLNLTRIPYVPYWNFGEELPVLAEHGKDPEQISYSFETLAALIARGLGESESLVRNRDSYVAESWKDKPPTVVSNEGVMQRKPISVVVCYSVRDHQLVSELISHLQVLRMQGVIDALTERMVAPRDGGELRVNEQLEEADIILPCLSADFLGLDYAQGAEMKRALERMKEGQAKVIPIILRPVIWVRTEFAHLSVLPDNRTPVTRFEDVEDAFASISQDIAWIATDLRKLSEQKSK